MPYSPVNFGDNKVLGAYIRLTELFSLGEQQQLGYRLSYNYLDPQTHAATSVLFQAGENMPLNN